MNTNQLTYFIAVAENQNFTKAAAQCYLTQTAITQQIQILEKQMDVVLIDRTSRPIKLTQAGHIFYHEAKDILARINLAIQNTKNAHNAASGLLRIGYAKTFESSNLPNLIVSFHREYENINLQIFRNDVDNLVFGLLNNEYDIIFTWDSTNLKTQEGVSCRTVEKARLVVALYAGHPLAQRQQLRRQELRGETILYMSPDAADDSYGDAFFMQLYNEAGYKPNILFRSADTESILMMVSAEEGISILPAYCVEKLYNADNLVFVPLIGEGEVEEIIAAWQTTNPNPALARFLAMTPPQWE
mgnify:CR=1 FL=1